MFKVGSNVWVCTRYLYHIDLRTSPIDSDLTHILSQFIMSISASKLIIFESHSSVQLPKKAVASVVSPRCRVYNITLTIPRQI